MSKLPPLLWLPTRSRLAPALRLFLPPRRRCGRGFVRPGPVWQELVRTLLAFGRRTRAVPLGTERQRKRDGVGAAERTLPAQTRASGRLGAVGPGRGAARVDRVGTWGAEGADAARHPSVNEGRVGRHGDEPAAVDPLAGVSRGRGVVGEGGVHAGEHLPMSTQSRGLRVRSQRREDGLRFVHGRVVTGIVSLPVGGGVEFFVEVQLQVLYGLVQGLLGVAEAAAASPEVALLQRAVAGYAGRGGLSEHL